MKLTDEQIAELAPEWATHYAINEEFGGVIFESETFFIWFFFGCGFGSKRTQLHYGINENSKPIPRKPESFDISQHEWSDVMANLKAMKSERGDVVIRIGSSWIFLDKADSIAIAKHFSLTAGDLK